MNRKWTLLASIALSSLAGATQAQTQAQTSAALHTRSLAATCANCHGTDGKAVQGTAVPGLAGLSKAHIVTQMQAFKAGTRPSTIMQQLAKGFSDAQVEQLAGYFAAQKP